MSAEVKKHLFEILRFIDELEAIANESNSYERFSKDAKAIRAMERLYEIIGEATRKAIEKQPGLPISDSRKIIALRNILAHNYDNVAARILWETASKGIPTLKVEVESLLNID